MSMSWNCLIGPMLDFNKTLIMVIFCYILLYLISKDQLSGEIVYDLL